MYVHSIELTVYVFSFNTKCKIEVNFLEVWHHYAHCEV